MKVFLVVVFILGNLSHNFSYSQNLKSWYGEYTFSEELVKANGGYSMMMLWSLNIYHEKGQELGMLEVNGQQTELKYVIYFVGNETSITAYFEEAIAETNPEDLVRGVALFTLTKTEEGIVTTWIKMGLRLVGTDEKQCLNCFVKAVAE